MQLSEEIKNKIISLYPHTSVGEISKILSIHRTTVTRTIQNSGLKESNPLSDKDKKFILENYPNISIIDLAKKLGISRDKVTSVLKVNGITNLTNKIIFTQEQISQCKELYKTKTLEEIAVIMNCTRPTIAKLLKDNNITINSTPSKLLLTNDDNILITNLIKNNWLLINHIADFYNVSYPTIKDNYKEIDVNLTKEDTINLFCKLNKKFNYIFKDYSLNKDNINNSREYVEKLTTKHKLNNNTVRYSLELIDENFEYFKDIDLIKTIFDMYYTDKLSTTKIGVKLGLADSWVSKLINRNGGVCNNTYSYKESEAEIEIRNYLQQFVDDISNKQNKTILNGLEIDILSEKHKIGIEYNGLYFHSVEHGKGKDYHLNKTLLANEKGYKLVHVFQDEYIKHKDIVLSKLNSLFGINNDLTIISARKCVIKQIKENVSDFLNKNHIQGSTTSSIKYGAYYNNELVSVMLFDSNTLYCSSNKENNMYELTRFCINNKYKITGIANRLLKQFIIDYKPSEIVSFADRRWTVDKDNNLYTKLGFVLDNIGKPNYFWFKNNRRYKSSTFKKDNLAKREDFKNIYSPDKTEVEMMHEAGYLRIYDCGLFRYKLYVK